MAFSFPSTSLVTSSLSLFFTSSMHHPPCRLHSPSMSLSLSSSHKPHLYELILTPTHFSISCFSLPSPSTNQFMPCLNLKSIYFSLLPQQTNSCPVSTLNLLLFASPIPKTTTNTCRPPDFQLPLLPCFFLDLQSTSACSKRGLQGGVGGETQREGKWKPSQQEADWRKGIVLASI